MLWLRGRSLHPVKPKGIVFGAFSVPTVPALDSEEEGSKYRDDDHNPLSMGKKGQNSLRRRIGPSPVGVYRHKLKSKRIGKGVIFSGIFQVISLSLVLSLYHILPKCLLFKPREFFLHRAQH